jgi:DNA-binding transcriptional LysR family regulator
MSLPAALLPELPALMVIAEESHFGRAAERLNVSQPRISHIVRRVEDIVGYQIFFRRPQVRLTPAGQVLTKCAEHALAELEIGLARAEDTAVGRRGSVRLGYAPVSMMTKLPRMLNAFRKRHPLVQLQLNTTHSHNLWAGFDAGQYDLIVSREARDHPDIENHLFVRDSLVAVLPEGDPAADDAEISIAALGDRDFVLGDEKIAPSWHRIVTSLCRSAGFEPRVEQRANDWGATLALVASGLGVSVVSSTLTKLHFPGVEFVNLTEGAGVGSFWISGSRTATDPAVQLLFSELTNEDALTGSDR